VITEVFERLEPVVGTKPACELTGRSRATVYRRRNPKPPVAGPRRAPLPHPAALSELEQARVLGVLRSQRFVDKSPAQIWATLLDEGTYLCSVSTMYRLLRAHGEVRERRAQATHPPRVRPELVATGPNLGCHQAQGPGQGRVLRPVRDAGHLLPQSGALARRAA
jgi:predicted DNA-binding transcriptional regulator AlpA